MIYISINVNLLKAMESKSNYSNQPKNLTTNSNKYADISIFEDSKNIMSLSGLFPNKNQYYNDNNKEEYNNNNNMFELYVNEIFDMIDDDEKESIKNIIKENNSQDKENSLEECTKKIESNLNELKRKLKKKLKKKSNKQNQKNTEEIITKLSKINKCLEKTKEYIKNLEKERKSLELKQKELDKKKKNLESEKVKNLQIGNEILNQTFTLNEKKQYIEEEMSKILNEKKNNHMSNIINKSENNLHQLHKLYTQKIKLKKRFDELTLEVNEYNKKIGNLCQNQLLQSVNRGIYNKYGDVKDEQLLKKIFEICPTMRKNSAVRIRDQILEQRKVLKEGDEIIKESDNFGKQLVLIDKKIAVLENENKTLYDEEQEELKNNPKSLENLFEIDEKWEDFTNTNIREYHNTIGENKQKMMKLYKKNQEMSKEISQITNEQKKTGEEIQEINSRQKNKENAENSQKTELLKIQTQLHKKKQD